MLVFKQTIKHRCGADILHFLVTYMDIPYICHDRKSNLVEFQILLVESPVGVSTGRKSNWSSYQHKVATVAEW